MNVISTSLMDSLARALVEGCELASYLVLQKCACAFSSEVHARSGFAVHMCTLLRRWSVLAKIVTND